MTPEKAAENNQIRFSQSWRSVAPRFFLAFVLGALVFYFTFGGELFGLRIPLNALGIPATITLPTALLVFLVFLARPLLLLFDSSYEISDHHLRAARGKCSVHRVDIELPFEDIQGVRVTSSILERLLGVGTVLVWTASAKNPELIMTGIARPHDRSRLIGERIDRARLRLRSRSV